jgi:hypothetical protein
MYHLELTPKSYELTPFYVSNLTLHRDLKVPFVKDLAVRSYHSTPSTHPNPLVQRLSSRTHPDDRVRRLRRQWPRDNLVRLL